MTLNGWLQIAFFLLAILLVTKPLGVFMARVFNRERTFLDPVLRPVERLLYRIMFVDENHEMRWTEYAICMLLFSIVPMLLLYLIQRAQAFLPFNPQKFGAVAQYLARWADKLDLEATAVIEDADAVTAYSKIAGVKPKAQGTTS